MVEENEKSGDMTWEEMHRYIDLVVSEEEFEKRYGECPKVGLLFGWRRFRKWRHEFNIFNEGVKFGKMRAWEWIKNSGWLRKEIQEGIDADRESG
jgi:hypothetical protein